MAATGGGELKANFVRLSFSRVKICALDETPVRRVCLTMTIIIIILGKHTRRARDNESPALHIARRRRDVRCLCGFFFYYLFYPSFLPSGRGICPLAGGRKIKVTKRIMHMPVWTTTRGPARVAFFSPNIVSHRRHTHARHSVSQRIRRRVLLCRLLQRTPTTHRATRYT